jgi:hypothetical protein
MYPPRSLLLPGLALAGAALFLATPATQAGARPLAAGRG